MMKLTVKQFSDIQTAIEVRDCVQETRQNLYLLSTVCKSKYRRTTCRNDEFNYENRK